MPLYADELVTVDGEFRPSAEVPDIPSFSQLHQQIFGKLGSGPLWETLKTINLTHAMHATPGCSEHTAGSGCGATPGLFADDQGSGIHPRVQKNYPFRSELSGRRRSGQAD